MKRAGQELAVTMWRRILGIGIVVCLLWAIEGAVASGPFIEVYGDQASNLFSIALFAGAFVLATLVAVSRPQPGTVDSDVEWSPGAIARFACVSSIALSAFGYATGRAMYNPFLGEEGRAGDIVAFIWAPVALGAVAALLSVQRKLQLVDWALLSSVALVSSLIGGRTTPGLIGVMVLLRFLIFPTFPSFQPRRLNVRIVLIVAVGTILFALALSAVAASRAESDGFSDGNLAYYGYTAWPSYLQYLVATLGVIGESAHVTHAVVPGLVPYQGFRILLEDVFSFMPGASLTVTKSTIDLYRAAGSIVFVSRPGGTAATLFMLGGNLGVILGAAIYGYMLVQLARRSYNRGSFGSSAVFLLLGATFIVGVYGTGTPTALTLLSMVVAGTIIFAARLFRRVRQLGGSAHASDRA